VAQLQQSLDDIQLSGKSVREASFLLMESLATEGTTQSDTMGMPKYGLGILPLICNLDAH